MGAEFYSLSMLLERERIGHQDEDRDALIEAIANEENQ
jgi:hypothetical protein